MPSLRKLIKLKHEADSLGIKINSFGIKIDSICLQIQQLRTDLLASKLDMKREAEQPFDSEVDQHQKGHKVNFDLPPKFDEYEVKQEEVEEEKEETEGEYVEEEIEEEVQALVMNIQVDEGQEVGFDLPPKFDEYESDEGDVLVMNSTCKELKNELVESVESDELTFATPHPPKDKVHHTIPFNSFGETTATLSIPPPSQAHKQNFCHFQKPPTIHNPNSEGKEEKQVIRIKPDLFDALILFQLER